VARLRPGPKQLRPPGEDAPLWSKVLLVLGAMVLGLAVLEVLARVLHLGPVDSGSHTRSLVGATFLAHLVGSPVTSSVRRTSRSTAEGCAIVSIPTTRPPTSPASSSLGIP
jgi:hypothetical protein